VEKIAIFDLTAKSGGQLLSHEDAEGAITPTEAVIEEYSNILPSALEDKFFKIALGVGLIVFLLSLPGFHFSIKGVFSSLVLSVVSVVIIFGLSQLNPKTTKKLLKKRLEEIVKSIGCKKCNFEYKI